LGGAFGSQGHFGGGASTGLAVRRAKARGGHPLG
jgi:hypothetical protein